MLEGWLGCCSQSSIITFATKVLEIIGQIFAQSVVLESKGSFFQWWKIPLKKRNLLTIPNWVEVHRIVLGQLWIKCHYCSIYPLRSPESFDCIKKQIKSFNCRKKQIKDLFIQRKSIDEFQRNGSKMWSSKLNWNWKNAESLLCFGVDRAGSFMKARKQVFLSNERPDYKVVSDGSRIMVDLRKTNNQQRQSTFQWRVYNACTSCTNSYQTCWLLWNHQSKSVTN